VVQGRAFFFAEWDYRKASAPPKVGLLSMYVASVADVAWSIIKKNRKPKTK